MNKIKKYILFGLLTMVLLFGSVFFVKNVSAEDIVPPLELADPIDPALEEPDTTPALDPTPAPVENVSLTIRSGNQTIFSGNISLPDNGQNILTDNAGAEHSVDSRSVLNILELADAEDDSFNISDLAYYAAFSSFYLKCMNISGVDQCDNWQYVVNDAYSQSSMDQNVLSANDTVFIYFGSPHQISIEKSTVFTGETFSAFAQDYDYKNNAWLPLTGVTLGIAQDDPENPWTPIEISTMAVDEEGKADFILDTEGDYKIGIKEDYYFPVENIFVVAPTVSVTLRSGGSVIFSGNVNLPTNGIAKIKDKTDTEHDVSAKSILNILTLTDAQSDAFNISDLTYYDSFGSFYLKCINSTTDECDNWQYVVNGTYSQTGIDKLDLKAGDVVYLYYGSAHQILLSKNTVETNESFSVTAQNYDYENDAWVPLLDVTLGVIQDDPESPWTPIEISTIEVDDTGTALFSVATAGDYKIGIKEDYYFPTQNLTVSNPVVVTTGGCSPCGTTNEVANFDTSKAVSFLISKQASDGSFGGNALYTDWGAVALGAVSGYDAEKEKLKNYLIANTNPGSNLSDYERRAMALMSLGINPYSGTSVNYIQKIIDRYDGNQFGDISLYNDDIFALIVLKNAGYSFDDPMIISSAKFIISKQKSDGSWDSIDMTSAGIQALINTGGVDVSNAVAKAKQFLQNSQKSDGGFGNVFSTSWAMQAISTVGEDQNSWVKNSNTPNSYLASKQVTDGSVNAYGGENAIFWATEYAIPASLGKKWSEIMATFSKPVVVTPSGGCTSCGWPSEDQAYEDNVEEIQDEDTEDTEDEIIDEEEKEDLQIFGCEVGNMYNTNTGEKCTVGPFNKEKKDNQDVKVDDASKEIVVEKIVALSTTEPKITNEDLDQEIYMIPGSEISVEENNIAEFQTASAVDALGQNNDSGKIKNIIKSAVSSVYSGLKSFGSFFKRLFAWL